ncbi:MAG: L,D-transpeptidase [Gammaproteobacteria bacterium]|jgi:hypothetical protein|nr:L,D-transpeptidase [Gammaproteobacteria bacterium]MBT4461875.1 L,D-transpeptidase [Gammaproteobacteria bacterium]MBT4654264.1 L,D-transpeptidase [Gammaproteobacteria bacterium]MBT5116290.1 L,D-transpeptidase [Gammaproteobacteria bacterium]MBT5761169.1 L,D-transpeptidase [Gammaproteobacteria bacterium]
MSDTELLITKAVGKIFTERFPSINSEKYILVLPSKQMLFLITSSSIASSYPISTSKFGLGNQNDSFKTPLGLHYISDKIGNDAPKMTIFRGRKTLKGELTLSDLDLPENKEIRNKHFLSHEDVITSRILWLKGHEEGINKGKNIDSYSRYIYIHGTAHEDKIGTPASHGCVRMNNDDVIELFNNTFIGMPVLISDLTD